MTTRLASGEPVPGGGSAAAAAGALAAALVEMVGELTRGRGEYADYEAAVHEIGQAAAGLRRELLELADADATAYREVVDARRLPKETDRERARRRSALQAATVAATQVPLRTAQAATRVLDLAGRIAPIGNRHAISDAGVAADLAAAAVRGALLNVRINLPGLPEGDPFRAEAESELARLESSVTEREGTVRTAVLARLAR